MSKNLEACDLRKANDTARNKLVGFLRDQLADDFISRMIDCVVFVKQTNLVLVGSDEFGKNRGRWSWVGYDRMNAWISWCN